MILQFILPLADTVVTQWDTAAVIFAKLATIAALVALEWIFRRLRILDH